MQIARWLCNVESTFAIEFVHTHTHTQISQSNEIFQRPQFETSAITDCPRSSNRGTCAFHVTRNEKWKRIADTWALTRRRKANKKEIVTAKNEQEKQRDVDGCWVRNHCFVCQTNKLNKLISPLSLSQSLSLPLSLSLVCLSPGFNLSLTPSLSPSACMSLSHTDQRKLVCVCVPFLWLGIGIKIIWRMFIFFVCVCRRKSSSFRQVG